MTKTVSLQTAIKLFERRARNIALHCVAKQDEWHFQTCQATGNRLEELAISNRHAATRGMPQISGHDAKRVTTAILAMRGVNQKKQKLIHQDDSLGLQRRPLAYTGLSRAWLKHFTNTKEVDD